MNKIIGSVASLTVGLTLCGALLAYGVTEEIAVGGVEGVVTMKENGKALANALITLRSPDKEKSPLRPRTTISGPDGRFSLRNVQAGTYKIEVSAMAHTLAAGDDVVIAEGRPSNLELEAAPNPPYLDLYANQRVFVPGEAPEIQVRGFVDSPSVAVSIYKLNFDQVMAEGSLYSALAPLAGQYNRKSKDPRTMGTLASSEQHLIQNRDAEGTFIDVVKAEKLPEGIYWVQCDAKGITRGTWFMVSRIAMVVKNVGKDANCFVTRMDTGEPVSGAEIGEAVKGTYRKLASTDTNGLAKVAVSTSSSQPVVVAVFGASRALVNFYKGEDQEGPAKAYVYTDRPIYRPGDEVSYKGILRKLNGSDYELPEAGTVSVKLTNDDGTPIEQAESGLSSMGSYHGVFKLSREANPGYYTIETTYGENVYTTGFSVATYRKPAYSIRVTSAQKSYVVGQKAHVEVKAEYYFGGPVVGAEVTAMVFKQPYFDPRLWGEDYEDWWSEEEGQDGYGGDYLADLTGTTDENGVVSFEIDTAAQTSDTSEGNSYEDEYDSTISVAASVTDESGKYFDGQGSFRVVRGEFSLATETQSYVVSPGDKVSIDVRALANTPGVNVENLSVALTAGYEVWDRGKSDFSMRSSKTVSLNAEGRATAEFSAETPGSFVIKALATDARGNRVSRSAYVWVYGRGSWYQPDQRGIDAKLDKRKYSPGDVAKLIVSSSDAGGYALVTVEGTKVYSTQVVHLADQATLVELPVQPEYLPNAYVSVVYIKNKRYSEVSKLLAVDTSIKELKIKVTADKQTYLPGETAKYEIETRNQEGAAVQAECSLALVDESIYSIASDPLDMVGAFYPRRYSAVGTNYSFPTLYLDGGDKAPSSIQVRRLFKDTAYWNPSILTDSNGHASISIKLPDNLTSWRATVAGITGTTDVGQATSNVVASKPLMVRLEAPATLVVGDTVALRALVTNNTGKDAVVNLQLDATNATATGDSRRSQQLKSGETRSFEWMAEATLSGTAQFVSKVWIDGGASDGVELRVPSLPHGRTYIEQKTGTIRSTGTFDVVVRDGADRTAGGMVLSLIPSLGAVFVQTLDQLIGFPYGCVEQTMSRFLPTIAVSRAMKTAGLPAPKQAAQIPQMVADGYSRLSNMQHDDGGWGWWETDTSDPYMTAYVLEGIYLAGKAGYQPWGVDIQRASEWAAGYLKSPLPPARSDWEKKFRESNRLYLAYALALHGRASDVEPIIRSIDPYSCSATQAAYGLMASKVLGTPLESHRVAFLKRLRELGSQTASTVKWEESYWGVETTSRCLQALVANDATDPLVEKAVMHLLLARRGDMWFSTRDTAVTLIALSQVWASSHEFEASGDLVVKVNGKVLSTIPLNLEMFSKPQARLEIPMADLMPGRNVVELSRSDGGPCTYSAQLRQVVSQQQIGRIVNADDLGIDRRYFKLRTTKLEDGTMRLMPTKEPAVTFNAGDLVRCELTVKAGSEKQFVLIEDPIPAGFIVTERAELGEGESWENWWAKTVIREDRVAFFMDDLTAGTHVLTYNLRAETTGSAHALPAVISLMYDPGVRAGCPEDLVTVKPK